MSHVLDFIKSFDWGHAILFALFATYVWWEIHKMERKLYRHIERQFERIWRNDHAQHGPDS